MALRLRRGTDTQRQLITPAEGELIYTTDTKRLWIGDGTTQGGILANTGAVYGLDDLTDVDLTLAPQEGDVLRYDGTEWIASPESSPTTPGGSYYIDIEDSNGDPVLNSDTRVFLGSVRSADGVAILVDANNQRMYADFFGDLTGNVTGDVTGDVIGDLFGNVTGNVTGNISGFVTGNVTGDVTGDVTGNLLGNVNGDVNGNVTGDLTGSVFSTYGATLVNGNTGEHFGVFKGVVVNDDSSVLLDGPNRILSNSVVSVVDSVITTTLGSIIIDGTSGAVGPAVICQSPYTDPGLRVDSSSSSNNGPHITLNATTSNLVTTTPLTSGDSVGSVRFNGLAVTPVGNISATLGLINVKMVTESDGVSTAPEALMELTMPNGPNPATYKKATFSTSGVFNAPVFKATGYATGSLPTSPEEGWIVFDSTTKEFKGWNGTSWTVLG